MTAPDAPDTELAAPLVPTIALSALPPTLPPQLAERLFRELESGTPRTEAPAKVGLCYRTIRRWCAAFPAFGARMDEAMDIGHERTIDELRTVADTARDKDTAAAARAKADILERYLARANPKRFGPKASLFGGGDTDTGAALLIIPAKITGRGLPPSDVIEGSAVRITPPAA